MTRPSTHGPALLAMLTMSVPALAQEAAEPEGPAVKGQLPMVLVTAQKRVQASSKVPVALSAISDDDIKSLGLSTAANLTEQVPNVQISTQGTSTQIFIRGIGNADITERGDPSAAFHIDGIYVGRPQGAGATFYDLERVEVLRGPQGTLYGRNANAGAINLISRKPGARFETGLSTELGNYRSRNVDAMVNVPINAMLALRGVVSKQAHDGHADTATAANGLSRDAGDRDNLSGRVQALLKFSPQLSWLLGVDSSRDKGAGPASYDLTSGKLPDSRAYSPAPPVQGHIDIRTTGLLSELKAGLGSVDLSYLYGRRRTTRAEVGPVAPVFAIDFSSLFTQQSHELRLSSANAGPLQWVAGLYAFKEIGDKVDADFRMFKPDGPHFIHFVQGPVTNTSRALFGQATYSVSADWRATLGLRGNKDRKAREGKTYMGPAETPEPGVGNLADRSWSKQTYRLGAEHDLSKTQMVYLALATGYKAGGYNDRNDVPGDPSFNPHLYYNPESIRSLEAGLKGSYLDNRLQLGATLFRYDYQDLQVSTVVNSNLFTANAAKASVKGFELEGRASIGEDGRLNFALGLLNAKYLAYVAPNGSNLQGKALDRAPKATLMLGYTHHWDLPSGAHVSAYAGSRYSASFTLSDAGDAQTAPKTVVQPAQIKSDITLSYAPASDRWSVQAFVKNLEDRITLTTMSKGFVGYTGTLAEPRTLGLRASIKY